MNNKYFLHKFSLGNVFVELSVLLFQEDKSRVEIFKEYSVKRGESAWVHLLTLLNRPAGFIMNMTARVIAKMACW